MTDKIKCKIVYFTPAHYIGEWSTYDEVPSILHGVTEWDYLTKEEYEIIRGGTVRGPHDEHVVALVEPNPESKIWIFDTIKKQIEIAKKKIEDAKKKAAQYEKEEAKRKAERAEKAKKKKQAQLEKLKAELGIK